MTDKFIINRMACDNCKKIRKQTAEEIIKLLKESDCPIDIKYWCGSKKDLVRAGINVIREEIQKKYLEG